MLILSAVSLENIEFPAWFLADSSFTTLEICCLAALLLLSSWLQPISPGCKPGGEGGSGCSPWPLQAGGASTQELHPLTAVTCNGEKNTFCCRNGLDAQVMRLPIPVTAASAGSAGRISYTAPRYCKRHKDLRVRWEQKARMCITTLYRPTNGPTCSLARSQVMPCASTE